MARTQEERDRIDEEIADSLKEINEGLKKWLGSQDSSGTETPTAPPKSDDTPNPRNEDTTNGSDPPDNQPENQTETGTENGGVLQTPAAGATSPVDQTPEPVTTPNPRRGLPWGRSRNQS